ncbi:MAG: transcription antitermination factor NusB [Rickettsiales bacterium]|nr:transcription antitermination factor NusB [Pseudomonadota bacterium]MDA0965996.1 transcription antitermination factor NusB [Pseudomonadota bacterium]MDG4542533.1 transcription antitermination factor NusB [Rickettsiales bacterium]MDG4545037.1 transcription antitermination factor NusB [Rickettsiales bacterium]MDG4547160.1 transcription antitermination factor NusB [Rickettsiales bacterium]
MKDKAQSGGKRTNTRLAAVKALYSSEINELSDKSKTPGELMIDIIEFYYETEGKNKNLDQEFLNELIQGVCENKTILDKSIVSKLGDGWKIERLGPVMLSILRTAVFEMMNHGGTHLKIIINEYVGITRSFFDEKEVGFVNGILDKIGHEVRS